MIGFAGRSAIAYSGRAAAITAVVEQFGEVFRVTVYRDGKLDHRAWFSGESAANYYAELMRLEN
jgi:hypothetical protein